MTYLNLKKQMLMASIDELSKTPEIYAVHSDKDFTRNRKISFLRTLHVSSTKASTRIHYLQKRSEITRFCGLKK